MNISRKKAFSNFFWKLSERVGAQLVSFVVSVILARLLYPEDYSVVSIISILSSFCTVFIDGGLSKSLIQNKNSDILDFSTVLFVNVGVSFILYIVLFVSAPFIADIYNNDLLIPVVRVYSINLIIGAFNTVLCAFVSKTFQFQKFFMATIAGTVISAAAGIYMAFSGFGAWSLVAQQTINVFIDTLLLFITTKFRPKFYFSLNRLKTHWSFGSKVLGTSLMDMLYDNVRPLVVGMRFNSEDLAYYQKGRSFPDIINNTLNSTLSAVLFPVIASVQDDLKMVKDITQRYIRIASFLLFPSLIGSAVVAPNLITWMLTDKWAESVPYMQIFCINYMFLLLQTGNLQAINAVGRSDIVLKLAIIKKSINFILLILLLSFSKTPFPLAAIGIITSFIAFIINAGANKHILNYGFREQVRDIFPNMISSLFMAITVLYTGKLDLEIFPLLCLQILSGIMVYILLAVITHNPSFFYCCRILKNDLIKSNSKGEKAFMQK